MRGRGLITVVAFAGALPATAHADAGVNVGNNAFSPMQVTVVEGEVVTWTWTGPDTNHSVTSVAENDLRGSFDSDFDNQIPNHPVGHKFSHTFEFDGEYEYFCKVHPNIRGKVIVRPLVNDSTPLPPDVAPPKFSSKRLSLRKRKFTFRLNEPAAVTVKLRGPTKRTRRFEGKVGRNKVKLPKRLKAGRYKLKITAVDESHNVRRYTRRFRISKKR